MSKKVLLIGLDGFSPYIFDYIRKTGVMPALTSLADAGSGGVLESIFPFETSPAWSSLQTGCNPDKTGIYSFHRYVNEQRKICLNGFQFNKMPSIWELLSAEGKRVININMPVTSPPAKVNGIMIPGLLCPGIKPENVYPSEVYEKYIAKVPGYRIIDRKWTADFDENITRFCDVVNARRALARDILTNEPFDLASVQFQMTDFIQHKAWYAIDPTHPEFSEEMFAKVSRLYACVDEAIKELVEIAGEDCLKICVSDHGFCTHRYGFGLNTWLLRKGYLRLLPQKELEKNSSLESLKAKYPLVKTLAKQYGNIKKALKAVSRKKGGAIFLEDLSHLRRIIDLEKPSLFCLGLMGGMLFATDDFDLSRLDSLKRELLADFGPSAERQVIKDIRITGNRGNKPVMEVVFADGVSNLVTPTIYDNNPIIVEPYKDGLSGGTHHINGFFVVSGEGVKAQKMDAKLIDIAPTILACLGADVPEHMDGKVLASLFAAGLNANYSDESGTEKQREMYSDDEQADVEEQLHGLGYI
jgi:predicted AlkP superfamily phosphohydrolase/phosphomutase